MPAHAQHRLGSAMQRGSGTRRPNITAPTHHDACFSWAVKCETHRGAIEGPAGAGCRPVSSRGGMRVPIGALYEVSLLAAPSAQAQQLAGAFGLGGELSLD